METYKTRFVQLWGVLAALSVNGELWEEAFPFTLRFRVPLRVA